MTVYQADHLLIGQGYRHRDQVLAHVEAKLTHGVESQVTKDRRVLTGPVVITRTQEGPTTRVRAEALAVEL